MSTSLSPRVVKHNGAGPDHRILFNSRYVIPRCSRNPTPASPNTGVQMLEHMTARPGASLENNDVLEFCRCHKPLKR